MNVAKSGGQSEGSRIDGFPILADFIMQMWTGRMPGISGQSDRLPGGHILPDLDWDRGEVAVKGLIWTILDDYQVAVPLVIPSRVDHLARHRRLGRRANYHAKIEPIVAWVESLGQWPMDRHPVWAVRGDQVR